MATDLRGLTDEEIEREIEHVGMLPPEHPVYKRLARRIERIVAERERQRATRILGEICCCGVCEWCGASRTILRDDGAGDDAKGGERGR